MISWRPSLHPVLYTRYVAFLECEKRLAVLSLGDSFHTSLTFLKYFTLKPLQIRSSGCSSYEGFSRVFLELVLILITFRFLTSCCASHDMLTFSP